MQTVIDCYALGAKCVIAALAYSWRTAAGQLRATTRLLEKREQDEMSAALRPGGPRLRDPKTGRYLKR